MYVTQTDWALLLHNPGKLHVACIGTKSTHRVERRTILIGDITAINRIDHVEQTDSSFLRHMFVYS